MREILKSRTTLPDHIMSLLKLYIEEKEKIKQLTIDKKNRQTQRISVKKMRLIEREFSLLAGQRSIKHLDEHLRNLKFFIRHSEDDRKMIYECAKFINYPARTVIFNQGDEGDNMYVILKGRVAVELKQEDL